MPSRFVILFHQVPTQPEPDPNQPLSRAADHWDLMLESGSHLETWSLATEPQPSRVIPAFHLAPHRKDYLNYEGKVSGDRGHVRRLQSGTWRFLNCNGTNYTTTVSAGQIEQLTDPATSSSQALSAFSATSFSIELNFGNWAWKADFENQLDNEWTISIEKTP